MTFVQLPPATVVFLDANTLIYHFSNEPTYGPACTQLLKRVELGGLSGFTSAHALADVAHRLMTLEAMNRNVWPQAGLAARLRKRHSEIPHLSIYQQAIARIPLLGIQVLPIAYPTVEAATLLSQQHELLTGDALIVAVMRQHRLTALASEDADFDRVPGLTRYAPV
jgi:predicted nucleic acid-binding protein